MEIRIKEHWRDPATRQSYLIREDGLVVSRHSGDTVGELFDEVRRIEWKAQLESGVGNRVASEKLRFDTWANEEMKKELAYTEALSPDQEAEWWDAQLYNSYALKKTIADTPQLRDLFGKRVLDIGGSMMDSWRFLWFGGCESIDHIEVSPMTQEFAFERINRLFEKRPEMIERITYHTAPAEQLPFADQSFDLIFSRATIHHTKRPEVFHEIARVLKPGGIFWMIEPRLSDSLYAVMMWLRRARRVDRGTDDPLRNHELDTLSDILSIERVQASRLLSPIFAFLANQLLGKAEIGNRLAYRIDEALLRAGLGRKRGNNISLVARKP